jgi:Inner membrane protein YgaP-like, transmembrane domain
MSIERIVFAVAGAFILISVLLAVYVNINWLWFTGFVGANLLQSAFTGFCPLATILKKMGKQPGAAF